MVSDWIIAQIGEPPPKPPTDPDAYAAFPYEAKEAWRDWTRKEEDLVVHGLEQGNTLADMGYQNKPDEGKSMYSRFGPGGLYSEYGANVNPNFRYDWASGRKYDIATTDQNWNKNNPNGIPITADEYAGYQQAQRMKGMGLTDYGQQAAYQAFGRAVSRGHFTQDPTTGNYYNVGQGDPNNPQTWEWKDQFGRAISSPSWLQGRTWLNEMGGKNGTGNQAANYGRPGVSSYGGGAYGGGGGFGGYSGFGGGDPYASAFGGFGGGGFGSPGSEAQGWGAANLSNAQAEQIRNDILGQQLQLQKGLEGRAIGGSIYDYLMNDVYGSILGVQFDPNRQGVAQFSQGLNQQIQNPTFGTTYQPGTVTVGGPGAPFQAPEGEVAKVGAEGQPFQAPEGEVAKEPTQQVQKEAAAAPTASSLAAPDSGQVGKAPAYVEKQAAQDYTGPTVGKDVLDQFEADLNNGNVPKDSARTVLEQEVQRNPSNQRAQQLLQQVNVMFPKQTGAPGGQVQAMGQQAPMGSYKNTGVSAFDPNQNQSWARFLAPTYGKVGELTQQNVDRLRREMPRGGEQNRSVSDAINSGYKTMQEGWQSLVPTALQGLSGIGQEMYFQQPSPNSGATGIASNYQLGLKQLAQNQSQFDTTRQDKKDAEPGFWGTLGGYVANNINQGAQALGSAAMSDERSKKGAKPFGRGLRELRQLDPVSYEYNGKYGTTDGIPGVSVMAQQLERVMPEAVVRVKTPDGPARAILPLALQMATINAVKDLDRRISDFAKKNG